MLERERHADHRAHGQAHPMRLLDAQAIEEGEDIVGHALEGIGPLRDRTLAVAARVEANHMMVAIEATCEVIPHAVVHPDRVREHDRVAAARVRVEQLTALTGPFSACPPRRPPRSLPALRGTPVFAAGTPQ
jgi:hypothetical protein